LSNCIGDSDLAAAQQTDYAWAHRARALSEAGRRTGRVDIATPNALRAWLASTLVIAALTAGCTGLGPPTVARDRFDYVSAISESWKKQALLNLVKTRYADAPVFMDVTSVINQYSLEGQVNLAATWAESGVADTRTLGGSAWYSDRPTITYSPVTGEKFTRNFMTPIPVQGILFLLQSGYAADRVFRLCVHTINGIENSFGSATVERRGDGRFPELITALREIQLAGGLGMRVRTTVEDEKSLVIFFRPLSDASVARSLEKIRELLNIDPDAKEIEVV